MNGYVALILGIIIGFLIEWVIDWFYWRRRAKALEGTIVDLQKENTSLENRLLTLQQENQHLHELYDEPLEEVGESEFTTQPVAQEETEWMPAFLDEEEVVVVEDAEESEEGGIGLKEAAAVAGAAAVVEEVRGPDEASEVIEAEPVVEVVELEQLEMIGENEAALLKQAGINTPQQLVTAGATAKGRAELADKTGLSQAEIMDWVNQAELYQLEGVSTADAQDLVAAGVDTVVGLATADPGKLHSNLVDIYGTQHPGEDPPGIEQVESWVQEAKKNPAAAAYLAVQDKLKGG